MTEIYTPRLSISRNFQRPKENHGTAQKKIIMMSDSIEEDLAISFI